MVEVVLVSKLLAGYILVVLAVSERDKMNTQTDRQIYRHNIISRLARHMKQSAGCHRVDISSGGSCIQKPRWPLD